jgi:uncharacterized metal-binding protein
MKTKSEDFTLEVDGVNGVCPVGEAWAEQQILKKRIPVLACEGPCIRGDIARLAANRVAKDGPFARACYAETFMVPHSSMARWVMEADYVVMVDGCFLKCIGRVLNNLVDEEKIVHMIPNHASSITKAASKQTYYILRYLADRQRIPDAYRAYAYFLDR